jgi:CheY-like chemotaxis protein
MEMPSSFTSSLHRIARHFTQPRAEKCSYNRRTFYGGENGMAAPTLVMLRSETAQETLRQPDSSRIRTVVVDDSPTFLQIACELLELDPVIDLVARAGKGGEAIETVMKLRPDMVLMDVHMPYLDGLTLAWFFANRFPSVRVVLMSTDESPELRDACEAAGAFDFVHKENFRQEFGTVMQRFCAGSFA